ncbi:MAG: hypothetical protein C4557_08835 [Anaerolineaceae bacterium]|nr:MAG: hypothetical protein C4557_08835 [Anaerolineaceae bacterium]
MILYTDDTEFSVKNEKNPFIPRNPCTKKARIQTLRKPWHYTTGAFKCCRFFLEIHSIQIPKINRQVAKNAKKKKKLGGLASLAVKKRKMF